MLPNESWRDGFNEHYPIYEQIIQRFCRSLVKGELKPGDRVPSIRDLALILRVNTNTIQRAYQEMERKNLIYSQRGTGYFVMEDENMIDMVKHEMVREATTRFIGEMRALGFGNSQILEEISNQLKGDAKDGGVA